MKISCLNNQCETIIYTDMLLQLKVNFVMINKTVIINDSLVYGKVRGRPLYS